MTWYKGSNIKDNLLEAGRKEIGWDSSHVASFRWSLDWSLSDPTLATGGWGGSKSRREHHWQPGLLVKGLPFLGTGYKDLQGSQRTVQAGRKVCGQDSLHVAAAQELFVILILL